MSSIRLLALGVVRTFQPIHGYDVRRELISWHAHEWGNVAPGSIYNALKSLTKEGHLEVTGTDKVGARPERTSYRLTQLGEQEFLRLLREAWGQVRIPSDPLMPALSFLPMLSRREVIGYLHLRAQQIEVMIAEIRRAQALLVVPGAGDPCPRRHFAGQRTYDGRAGFNNLKPEHVHETFELLIARIGSEAVWSQSLITRLEAGSYAMSDDSVLPTQRTAPRHAARRARAQAKLPAQVKPAGLSAAGMRDKVDRAIATNARDDRPRGIRAGHPVPAERRRRTGENPSTAVRGSAKLRSAR